LIERRAPKEMSAFEMNQDIKNGAKNTASAITRLMKRRSKQQGWI
jgi:hypothetical protein